MQDNSQLHVRTSYSLEPLPGGKMTFVLKDKQYSLRFICDWQRNRNSGLASCSKAKGKLGEEHHFWGKGVGRAAVWGSPGGG